MTERKTGESKAPKIEIGINLTSLHKRFKRDPKRETKNAMMTAIESKPMKNLNDQLGTNVGDVGADISIQETETVADVSVNHADN